MKVRRSVIVLCSLLVTAKLSVFASGQTVVWTSPDKTFSVEVPEKLERDNDPGIGESSDPSAVTVFASGKKKPAVAVIVLKYASYATKVLKISSVDYFLLLVATMIMSSSRRT